MTLPAYRRINLKSKATAVQKDLRTFADAFVSNNLQNSRWATDTGIAGQIPPEVTQQMVKPFSDSTCRSIREISASSSTSRMCPAELGESEGVAIDMQQS